MYLAVPLAGSGSATISSAQPKALWNTQASSRPTVCSPPLASPVVASRCVYPPMHSSSTSLLKPAAASAPAVRELRHSCSRRVDDLRMSSSDY